MMCNVWLWLYFQETIEFKEEQLIDTETKKKILKKPPFENCEQKGLYV
jgi:hypothetical protein